MYYRYADTGSMDATSTPTKKELAERWKVSERTIDQYKENCIIVSIKDLPCIRFNVHYIEKIEGRISEKVALRERKL